MTDDPLKQFNMQDQIHTFMHETKGMDMEQKMKIGKKLFMGKMKAAGVSAERQQKLDKQMEKMFMGVERGHEQMHKKEEFGGKWGKSARYSSPSIIDLYDHDGKGYITFEDWEKITKITDVNWDNKFSIEEFLMWMTYEEDTICGPYEKTIDEMLASIQ